MEMIENFDLIDPENFAAGPPHHIFDEIRKNAPIYGQPNPHGGTIWSLTRYDDVREVSKNVEDFSSAPLIVWTNRGADMKNQMKHNMMFLDPPLHTRLRGFVAKAFSPAIVARFEEWVRELCVGIADRVSLLEGEFDAVEHISAALPAHVIGSILGVPHEDRGRVAKLVMRMMAEFDPDIGPQGATDAVAEVMTYSLGLRELKLREPGVDMATQLATSEGDDRLSDEEYATLVQTLVSAGFETTHTLIAHSLLMMASDSNIRHGLDTTDRRKLAPVVDELLRLVTPTMYFGRNATRDLVFKDVAIAKDDFVITWFVAANRDPEKYENPHDFIIGRPGRNHVAFGGGGPHFCMGNHLAKLEVELLYQEFSKRGLKLELAGKPARLPGFFINGIRKLPMRVVR